MRTKIPEEATCAICGRYFDPSETRGWCPNPSCGEWQHPAFPLGDDPHPEPEPRPTSSEAKKTCPECGNEVQLDAKFCTDCAHQFTGDHPQPDDDDDEEEGGLRCPDCGWDLSGIQTDRLSRCPICQFRIPPDFGEEAEGTTPEPGAFTVCPNCGEDLSPIPSRLRTVCPGCRVDLDEWSGRPDPGPPEPEETSTEDDPASASIDTVGAIEPGFQPRLKEVGITTIRDLVTADPDALSKKTGISPGRIRGWIDDARSGTAESTDVGVGGEETVIRRGPRELVFEVTGREISVTDGQTVGSEIRRAMVDAGRSTEDAVFVHRKHVRVDGDEDGFFLTRLGENSLELNGKPVGRGSRVEIGDGDELTFSDVVTVTVSVR